MFLIRSSLILFFLFSPSLVLASGAPQSYIGTFGAWAKSQLPSYPYITLKNSAVNSSVSTSEDDSYCMGATYATATNCSVITVTVAMTTTEILSRLSGTVTTATQTTTASAFMDGGSYNYSTLVFTPPSASGLLYDFLTSTDFFNILYAFAFFLGVSCGL